MLWPNTWLMTILTRKVTSLCSSIYKVESTDKSCLQRQVSEGANLAACDADNILNSRTEYHQPSLQRITLTREPRGAGS